MKTNLIVKKQIVNGGAMITLTFAAPVAGFNTEQVGGCVLNCVENQINTTESDLQVGDSITDDFGGNAVIGAVHGQTENQFIAGKQADYRDAFNSKLHN